MDKHDSIELILMAIAYERMGERELASICDKAAEYLLKREKSAAERSA